jgi:hypothetical protein
VWPSLAGAGRLERETREEREGEFYEPALISPVHLKDGILVPPQDAPILAVVVRVPKVCSHAAGARERRRRGGSEGGAYCPGRDIRTDTLVVRRRRQKLDSQDSVSGVLQFFQRGRTAGLIADR